MPSEPRWFLANLVEIHYAAGPSGPALLECTAPAGDMPPLHVHEDEAEAFYVLDGTLEVWVGDTASVLQVGDACRADAGIPHTYRAGPDGARFLITAGPRFEGFVRSASVPASERTLPAPTPPDPEALGGQAAQAGITLLGPPGALPSGAPAAAAGPA